MGDGVMMNAISRWSGAAVVLSTIFCAGVGGGAKSMTPASRPTAPILLSVTSTPVRERLLPFEPIRLQVVLRNLSEAPRDIARNWDETTIVQYRRAGELEWTTIIRHRGPFVDTQPAYRPLHPTDFSAAALWLPAMHNDATPLLKISERFEIRAIVTGIKGQKGDSASATAQVSVPTPPVKEALALAELRDAARLTGAKGLGASPLLAELFFVRSTLPLAQHLATLDDFIRRHPDSAYSIYFRRAYVNAAPPLAETDAAVRARAAEADRWLQQNAPWLDVQGRPGKYVSTTQPASPPSSSPTTRTVRLNAKGQ